MATMSVTFGVSLAIIGSGPASRTAADDPLDGRGVDPEVEAVAHVRARDVQLDRRQPRLLAEHRGHRDELVLVLARDVGDHRRADGPEVGQVVATEVVDPVVVEADRVEQAGGGLDRPRASGCPRGAGG